MLPHPSNLASLDITFSELPPKLKEFFTVDYSDQQQRASYNKYVVESTAPTPQELARTQQFHRQIKSDIPASGGDGSIPPSVAAWYHTSQEKADAAAIAREKQIAWHEAELKRLRGY